MRQTILKSMVVACALALGAAACSSSSSSTPPKAATGQPLVIESTPLSPMTDNFNPLSSTSTGFLTNAVALYNEPLYIWNYLRPTDPAIPVRSGVKWNDGKPFSASDVAFTFNMIKAHPALFTSGAPVVTSASAPSATSVQLSFATPQYANLFLIGQVYIEPQHVWSKVSNPVTFADPSPVGTGPYMLDKFSPQGFTLKQNPYYYHKSSVRVPVIDFPSYNTNANLVPPIQSGSIDWAGNYVSDIQGNYLSKSPENHTWLSSAPYFSANNVVSLFVNTTKAPLNDPAVRQAIEFGINRQQLSTQAETGYELPATSTSGLMLPAQNSYQDQSLANNLPAAGDAAKVASILQADHWSKVNGKWTKNGKTLAFKISDPIPYSDYYTADQLIAHQLNALGFDVTVDGIGNPTVWAGDVANGTFDTTIRWSNQGPTPYVFYSGWLDKRLTAPVGKPATGDFGRFSNGAAEAALQQYESSGSTTAQNEAITKLQQVMTSEAPVIPLLYGGAWAEVSSRNYTNWPSASNPYMPPVPNTPYLEYTVLQLKPKS